MPDIEARGEMCQSCGHDMRHPTKRGTDRDGHPSGDFCRGCYFDGEFTLPDLSIEEMVGISVQSLLDNDPDLDPKEALERARGLLPTLKRWHEPHPEGTHSH